MINFKLGKQKFFRNFSHNTEPIPDVNRTCNSENEGSHEILISLDHNIMV